MGDALQQRLAPLLSDRQFEQIAPALDQLELEVRCACLAVFANNNPCSACVLTPARPVRRARSPATHTSSWPGRMQCTCWRTSITRTCECAARGARPQPCRPVQPQPPPASLAAAAGAGPGAQHSCMLHVGLPTPPARRPTCREDARFLWKRIPDEAKQVAAADPLRSSITCCALELIPPCTAPQAQCACTRRLACLSLKKTERGACRATQTWTLPGGCCSTFGTSSTRACGRHWRHISGRRQ